MLESVTATTNIYEKLEKMNEAIDMLYIILGMTSPVHENLRYLRGLVNILNEGHPHRVAGIDAIINEL